MRCRSSAWGDGSWRGWGTWSPPFSDPLLALEAFRAESSSFDMIVSDCLMPRMNGLQFARSVQEVRHNVPVLLLSGFIGDFTADELRPGGVRRVQQKAVGTDLLATAMRECLAGG